MIGREQEERYRRHLLLPEIGISGQEKLLRSSVLVVGAGGLGSPVLLYLAAAGVGQIGIADFDRVDMSNLQRQIIHSMKDVGRLKTASAAERIGHLNPDVKIRTFGCRFDTENASAMVRDFDVVVDATDSLAVKYLINDTCTDEGKPFVHGAISQFSGNVLTVLPGTACFRCVFPDAVQTEPSSEKGVFGMIPGITGSVQAAEVVKYLTGVGELLVNRLLSFDALAMRFDVVRVSRSAYCRCGQK